MTSDVVLSAAMRSNLLSLQGTQSSIDRVQNVLASGLKVSSALDNPQSFFASEGLKNRASDLTRLLDAMGQSIQTVKAANEGISGLTKLIEQADSLATTALEASSSAATSTSIVGDVDVTDFEVVAGTVGDMTFTFTDANGDALTVTGGAVALDATDDINDLLNSINSIRNEDNEQIVKASLTDAGRLQITTLQSVNARIEIDTDAGTLAATQTLSGQLGLSQIMQAETYDPAGAASTSVAVNLEASASISSQALYDATGSTDLAKRSTLLSAVFRDADGDDANDDKVFTVTAGNNGDTFSIDIGFNGAAKTSVAVDANTTIQGLIDSINADVNLNSRIEASFSETTGQITFAALDGGVESIEMSASANGIDANATTILSNFGFGSAPSNITASAGVGLTTVTATESIRFGSGGGEIAQAQADFNKVRTQIDALVRDSGYRGVNLLNGDDLVTTFNEDRTNTLTTSGGDFTVAGLGIDEAAFATRAGIQSALDQTRTALLSARDFGGAIANDLSIIQTREDFTKGMVNTLTEGSDKLTLADQNEEGAKLLALQTRQQLGVTTLSLASQAQQAVLRLF